MIHQAEFDVIDCPLDGRNLIEASAGTGKTYAISRIFLRLLLEKHYAIGKILAVTFTQAATEELRRRIRSILHDSRIAFEGGVAAEPLLQALISRCEAKQALASIDAALRDFDSAAIYTIHGFCQLLLHENAFECNQPFDTELINDQTDIFEEISEDFWRKHFLCASSLFISYALHKKITPDSLLGPLRQFVAHADLAAAPAAASPQMLPLERDFEALRRECHELWKQCRSEIVASLNPEYLDKKKYKAEACASLFADFDAFAASSSQGPQLFDNFEKLTSSRIAAATKKDSPPVKHEFFERCQALYDAAVKLREAFDVHVLALKRRFLSYACAELTARKEKRNVAYFDDLLLRVSKALCAFAGDARLAQTVGERFQAALIDEFQDTDPLQYAIFSALFPRGSILFLIGDPKQAIYSFRGADIFAYLKASRHVDRRYTLSVNYRSQPLLIQACNAFFCGRPDAFVHDAIRYRPVSPSPQRRGFVPADVGGDGPLILWILERSAGPSSIKPIAASSARRRIAEAVAAEIARLLSGDWTATYPVQPSHIAVLTRTNREAHIIRDTLATQGIPAVIEDADTVYGQPEAVEMLRLLSALYDPSRSDACMAALSTFFFGLNAPDIVSALASDFNGKQWMSVLYEYHDLWRNQGFMRMMQTLMARQYVRGRLLARPRGQRALTNVLHLAELIHTEESRRRITPGLTCAWLSKKIASPAAGISDDELVRLDSDASAVRVMTIHKSKGLEFPIVFCPFSWSGSEIAKAEKNGPLFYHDPLRGDAPAVALSPGEIRRCEEFAVRERLAENIRLLYVALTRAQRKCYCVWGIMASAETSSLAFLLHGGAPGVRSIPELAAYCGSMSDRQLMVDLASLARRGGDSIEVIPMNTGPSDRYRPKADAEGPFQCERFNATIPQPWSVSSFSSLTRVPASQKDEALAAAQADGADYPQHAPESTGAAADLHEFPRGARTGLFFHDVLEHLDFASADSRETSLDISRLLAQYGFTLTWSEPVLRMIKGLTRMQLPGATGPFSLSAVSPSRCMREVEFYFPLKHIEPADVEHFIRACEAGSAVASGWRTPRLAFSRVHGYMKGFIDCVVEHDGRYYLIDWKSNYIGSSFDDYSGAALEAIMAGQDYTLQYLIYLTALDALLGLRLPDYRYEERIGGVAYIFLRGISAARGNAAGVFFRKPPEDVVRAISERLIKREL